MANLDKDELKEMLEKIYDELFKNVEGAGKKKEEVLEQVANHLINTPGLELTRDNIVGNKNVTKVLCLGMMSELALTGLSPEKKLEFKLDYSKFFLDKSPEALKKEMIEDLARILAAMHQQLNPDAPRPDFRKVAEQMVEQLDLEFEKQVEARNTVVIDMYEKLLLAMMVALIGYSPNGKEPTVPVNDTITEINIVNTEKESNTSIMGREQKESREDLGKAGDKSSVLDSLITNAIGPMLAKEYPKLNTPLDNKLRPRE